MKREVVGREDHCSRARHLLGGDRARPEERVGVQRGEQTRRLVCPVRFACACALVEAVEVLLRARIGVDLFAHRGELAHLIALHRRRGKVTRSAVALCLGEDRAACGTVPDGACTVRPTRTCTGRNGDVHVRPRQSAHAPTGTTSSRPSPPERVGPTGEQRLALVPAHARLIARTLPPSLAHI